MSAAPPLFHDAQALAAVFVQEFDGRGPAPMLRARLLQGALDLLEHLTLALEDFDREEQLERADAVLCVLRAELTLAHSVAVVDEELFLAASEHADTIGRQVGGWRRRLDATNGNLAEERASAGLPRPQALGSRPSYPGHPCGSLPAGSSDTPPDFDSDHDLLTCAAVAGTTLLTTSEWASATGTLLTTATTTLASASPSRPRTR